MAVFLINICKFNGCGITFPSLGDLIQHIEDTHIDYDPKVVEQKEQAQPACLPLSYVLRFISEDARKESPFIASTPNGAELKRKLAIKHHSYSMSSSNRSNTPTGSEMDEDEMVVTESEDSNDSWTTEEFSSEFIMRYGSRHSGTGSNGTPGNEKPFACPVPGCKKRYKNVNGIKYHSKNGHKKDGKVRKGYKCHCGKSYKTAQGLKNHALAAHNAGSESTLTTQHIVASSGGILLPRSQSPSQSLGSLSPSSISNMSSSASSCHGGSSSVHNVTNNSSNILQHLTNNVSATITGGNVVANSNGTLTATTVGGMNLQLHQQFSSIANNISSGGGNSTVGSQQQQTTGVIPLTEAFSTMSGTAHSQQYAAAAATSSAIPTMMMTTATPIMASKTFTPPPPSVNTSLNISTTFIEHKYSAKKSKEKFYANANLRTENHHHHQQQSQYHQRNKNQTLPKGISNESHDIIDVGNSTDLNVGLHSAIQELNENFKNTLIRKSIN